ncbi:MAG: hypothetical protein OHK0046_49630 [Anaerolineae bacterium]
MMRRFQPSTGLLLFLIVLGALVLRLIGINWDEYTHIHPDERFVTTITSRIGIVENLTDEARAACPDLSRARDYFDTACSAWNPNNVNRGSFVYGTLPVFLVHGVSQVVTDLNPFNLSNPSHWQSYDYVQLVGRAVNAVFDVLTVIVVYLIGRRMFISSPRYGLLAAALYACAVLAIQLSHFWTVDIISNFFFMLGLLAAVEISRHGRMWAVVLFGAALGAATASRINLALMAGLLPAAYLIYIQKTEGRLWLRRWGNWFTPTVLAMMLAAAISLLVFRVAQPYAFQGPTFFDWAFNQKWLDDNEYVSGLSRNATDGWPPSVQWFERISYVYPWANLVLYGMGLFLGVVATVALVGAIIGQVARWRISPVLGLPVVWILAYFAFVGGIHQMTMRYYLPLYGPLILLAVWALWAVWLRAPGIGRALIGVVFGGTVLWALAFVSIYTQPVTRIEASAWMFEEIPATVTFLDDAGEMFPANVDRNRFDTRLHTANRGESYIADPFDMTGPGVLRRLEVQFTDTVPTSVTIQLYRVGQDGSNTTVFVSGFETDATGRVVFEPEFFPGLESGSYRWHIQNDWQSEAPQLRYFVAQADWLMGSNPVSQGLRFASPYEPVQFVTLSPSQPLELRVDFEFTAVEVLIPHLIGDAPQLAFQMDGQVITANRVETIEGNSLLGPAQRYQLTQPLALNREKRPMLVTTTLDPLRLTGSVIATEGSWDDDLPIAYCFYTPEAQNDLLRRFEDCNKINRYALGHYTALPINMAETDSERKRLRMVDTLAKADYLTISSNRFYDAQVRVPRRFQMSIDYYERLFDEELGYTLVETFDRNPRLLFLELQDQVLPTSDAPAWLNEWESEEAFTVYDRPTVFIFRNDGFLLENFPTNIPQNTAPPVLAANVEALDLDALPDATFQIEPAPISAGDVTRDLIVWVLGFLVLGWVSFPLMYRLFPNLPLHGFALGRGVAWLALPFILWWLTSVLGGFFWSPVALWGMLLAYIALNGWIAYQYRATLRDYVRRNWRGILTVELLFLLVLCLGMVMRMVNPDLWHGSRGGEKPMDFAYFNAVLRTSTFPPPNPWLAGYGINYYYLGFVFASFPVKLGGFAPEVGYNLILGTLYAVVFVNVFTLAYALIPSTRAALKGGLALLGALFVMVSGNLGTIHLMLFPEPNMAPNRWYWYPTRILGESANRGGGAIHEIPAFSFLWGDLHPHVLALLPVTLFLVVTWLLVRYKKMWLGVPLGALAALIFMANSWDVILYVPIGAAAMWIASGGRLRRFVAFGIVVGLSGILSVAPYYLNFVLGENTSIRFWNEARSLMIPFLLVWGIPLGIVLTWLIYRFKARLFPQVRQPVEWGAVLGVGVLLLFLPGEIGTSALLVSMIALAVFLAVTDGREFRVIYGIIAAILAVILSVEYFAFSFDVARMNTVFKIAFQVWVWFGLLIPVLLYAMLRNRWYAQFALAVFLLGLGLLFPVKAIPARFDDNETDTITLDGLRFMNEMVLNRDGFTFNTVNDAGLINYLRGNAEGFPVIVEWYEREYWWNSRVSVQTGLPAVVGWRNHMRQQFTGLHNEIDQRINDVQALYNAGSAQRVREVIAQYGVDYIVFGELERSKANPATETILNDMVTAGELVVVYEGTNTTLYQVIERDEVVAAAG